MESALHFQVFNENLDCPVSNSLKMVRTAFKVYTSQLFPLAYEAVRFCKPPAQKPVELFGLLKNKGDTARRDKSRMRRLLCLGVQVFDALSLITICSLKICSTLYGVHNRVFEQSIEDPRLMPG